MGSQAASYSLFVQILRRFFCDDEPMDQTSDRISRVTTYIHYPRFEPFDFNREMAYHQSPDPKPNGLWISVGTEWEEFCQQNSFSEWVEFPAFEIKFAEGSNFCIITDANELIEFTDKYISDLQHNDNEVNEILFSYFIDWKRVSEDYDGIFIMPYIWSCRLSSHTRWYYGWDVASGCIWNLNTVLFTVEWKNEGCRTN